MRAGPAKNPLLLSTTWYYYNESGNVTWVVTNQAGTDEYTATRLVYATNGQTVTYMVNESWTWDGDPANCPTAYDVAFARDFRYDGARQRYLNRELDVNALMKGQIVPLTETWTDYDGDEPYGDYTVDTPGALDNARSFELGLGTVEPWTGSGGDFTSYYHTDLIGTTRWMTDFSGNPASSATYTAFGERIDGTNPRYGYAGAWGYQSHDEFPYLHVGARYYDPATGRFLQRDPIGIRGGLNVYAYVMNRPTAGVDPNGEGLLGLIGEIMVGVGGLVMVAAAIASSPGWFAAGLIVVVVGGVLYIWDSVLGVWKTANKVVAPITPGVGCRNQAVDDLLDEQMGKGGGTSGGSLGGAGPGSGPYVCFTSETLVQTAAGALPITEISPGDCVLSLDTRSNQRVEGLVARVITGSAHTVFEIQIDGETITCTAEHPFFVVGSGWTPARELAEGDRLVSTDGHPHAITVVRSHTLEEEITVYTLEIADYATFYVGNSSVLVHNKTLGP